MRNHRLKLVLLLLAALFVGMPWYVALNANQSVGYSYGCLHGSNQIECVAIDGTHLDRYRCLIFDQVNQSRITTMNGSIVVDGKNLLFPGQTNVAFLRPNNNLEFEKLEYEKIQPLKGGDSGVFYVFGWVPKFKKLDFGIPNEDFVISRTSDWK